MHTLCPRCQSENVITINIGRKTGGTLGALAGAASSIPRITAGASSGAYLGAIAGPPGIVAGSLTGAVLSGLVGGTAGCIAGTRLGEMLDRKIFDNYRCLSCELQFSQDIPD